MKSLNKSQASEKIIVMEYLHQKMQISYSANSGFVI
jgi:hypothetical protein